MARDSTDGFGGTDGPGGFGGLLDMVKNAQANAAKLQDTITRDLAKTKVEGSSGGGMVKVVMTAALEVTALHIAPEVIVKEGKEVLEDLVIAALNQALKKAREIDGQARKKGLGDLTSGLGGMDFSKLFGG